MRCEVIPDWAVEREEMVEVQLRRRGIRDVRVLQAMREIPREQFVPPECHILTYRDEPVPIGFGQTISQPYMTALMAQELELRGDETVLEVGSGSGYAAAVLGALAARVVTVEIVPGLVELARANLRRALRDGNVTVLRGDGSLGYSDAAPYDAISVAAGAPDVPASLLEQLEDPGRLAIPVGDRENQELRIIWKRDRRLTTRNASGCRFVPLRGSEGWR